MLRAGGLEISPADRVALHSAVARSGLPLYWCARLTVARSYADLMVFDRAFVGYFSSTDSHRTGESMPRDDSAPDAVHTENRARPSMWDDLRETGLSSAVHIRTDRDFRLMSPDDITSAARMIQEIAHRRLPARPHRWERHRRGGIDPRQATRDALRPDSSSEYELPRRRRRRRLRPVVVVIDTSHSMEPYVAPWIGLAHALVTTLGHPAVSVFFAGTGLDEVTGVLDQDPAKALSAALRAATGSGSGTRLASCVRELELQTRQRAELRGGTCVLVSDGLDSESPADLADAARSVRAVMRRFIWCTPLTGDPEFAPVQQSLVATLPHIDRLVAAHDVDSVLALGDLVFGHTPP